MNPANPSKDWPGYNGLNYLFVFGDSYSSVGYEPHHKPTEEKPLGVDFPGDTWTEDQKPNWVGHLINRYYPKTPLLVYDYATGGDTIIGLKRQVREYRQPGSPGHPDSEECWQGNNSLFVTWIGFNDIALPSLSAQSAKHAAVSRPLLKIPYLPYVLEIRATVGTVFELQEELYETGARNFLFLTIAPLPNSAKGQKSLFEQRENRCRTWNETLTNQALNDFAQAHPDASIFVFDAGDLFERMLADPSKYGFSDNAGRAFDQEVYWDNIHPTSAVHRIVAKAVADFLAGESVAEDQAEKFSIPSQDT